MNLFFLYKLVHLTRSTTKKYPYAAVAARIDKQYMFGCFTHKGDDIVIQWAGDGSDQTILPANAFLMDN